MCNPVLVLTAASYAYQMYGQYREGKDTQKMYRYQSALAMQNARRVKEQAEGQKKLIGLISEANITATQIAAAEDAKILSREDAVLTGEQKAAIGTAAIGGGTTAENIAVSDFNRSKLDQAAIRYTANIKSWQISNEAKRNIWVVGEEARSKIWSLESEAKQYDYAGDFAISAANIRTAGTLFEGASQVATKNKSLSKPKTTKSVTL